MRNAPNMFAWKSPDTSKSATVLAAVKNKPCGRPAKRTFLDRPSTRRR